MTENPAQSTSSFGGRGGGRGGSSFGRGGMSLPAPAAAPPAAATGGGGWGENASQPSAPPTRGGGFGFAGSRGGATSNNPATAEDFGDGGGSRRGGAPAGYGSSFGQRGGGAQQNNDGSAFGGAGRGGPSFGNSRGGGGGGGEGFGRRGDDWGPPPAANTGGFNAFGSGGPTVFGGNDGFNKQNNEPKPLPNNFVPSVRTVDDLYKEDADHEQNYISIAEGDEEVAVSGSNLEHVAVIESWKDAGFEPKLLENVVERAKYFRPRKIQAQCIPFIMEGRDVKGHAETGSGKTAAFMLPLINTIAKMDRSNTSSLDRPAPYAIIVEPTRELCGQVYEQGRKFAHDMPVAVARAYGQYNLRENMRELQMGCDILCATTGRLKQFVFEKMITLDKLKYFVLDEADTLLENNFLDDIRELLKFPDFPSKENRQTMLFSATFPELVQKLSVDVLKEDHVMISNKKLVSTNSRVVQRFMSVSRESKKDALLELLQKEQQEASEKDAENPAIRRTLVFVRTKRDTDLVSLYLVGKNIKATSIHGDRTQNLREIALQDFRNGKMSVLVATDVCARGIDIKDLEHVINFDLPGDSVTYVHRIGRTGRIKSGLATSFFDEMDNNDCNIAKDLVKFLEEVGQDVPEFLKKAIDGGAGFAMNYGAQDAAPAFKTDFPDIGNAPSSSGNNAQQKQEQPTEKDWVDDGW